MLLGGAFTNKIQPNDSASVAKDGPRESVISKKQMRQRAFDDFRKTHKRDTKKEFVVQKIWVCGPPFMSDNFDKDLTSLINERDDELYQKM